MKPDVRVFADVNELSLRAVDGVVRTINESVETNGRFSLVLSGGNTPRTLYRLLSSQFRDQIPWTKVHVFWGDERYVPRGDPHSNYRMARETLLDSVSAWECASYADRTAGPRRSGSGLRDDSEELFLQRVAAFRSGSPRARRRGTYCIAIPRITCLGGDEALGGISKSPGRAASAAYAHVASTHSSSQRLLPRDGIEQSTGLTSRSQWIA
jgi:hypothetical protein